ncbi:hypothetical protein Q7P35_004244 [Cladosporium inversicolor]
MQSLFVPTKARLSALAFVFAWVGVDAQTPVGGASSICDGSITITSFLAPYTVTIFTTGTFNASDIIPDSTSVAVSTPVISSLTGLSSLGTSGVGSVVPTGSLSLPSDGLPTSVSTELPSVSSQVLTGSVSLPSVPVSFTAPGLTTPSLTTLGGITSSGLLSALITSFSSIDLGGTSLNSPTLSSLDSLSLPGTTSLPTGSLPTLSSLTIGSISDISLPGSSVSLSLPALTTSFSNPMLSLPGETASLTIPPVSNTPSITFSVPETSLPITQLSSLSNVLSGSVTLPGVSLSSGLTTLILSSEIPSLSLQTLSPSLPILSLTGTLSDLNTSLAIPTGLTISLSSATALPGLPSTSPSGVLSTISLSLPGGIPTLVPTAASTRTTGSASPIPTASVLALVYCPYDDGLTYLSPESRPYGVKCYNRRVEDALSESPAPDLESCMDFCDEVPGCQGVSYNPSSGTCSYGDDPTSEIIDGDYSSGTTTDLSCPNADRAQYMDYTGSIYQVFCDFSFPQSTNITTAPGDDYLDCSDTCSSTSACTGFSYSDGLCTFTQGFGNPPTGSFRNGTQTVVMLAKRSVQPGPDGKPILKTIPVASIPSISGISPVTSLLAVVSGIDSVTATLLPPVTLSDLPSSLTILPSSISLPSITILPLSVSLSSITILPTTLTLPTITSLDISSLLNATTNSLPSTTILPSTLLLPTITSIGVSSLLNTPAISISTPGTPSLPSLGNSLLTLASATIPTSQGPTQTPVDYSCPANDGRVVIENGLTYLLNCRSTTDGMAYSSKEAAASFNNCFRECDQSSVFGGANYCTAFTYEGAENGVGSGTCYLFNGVTQGFRPASGRNTITAIRAVNYVPGAVLDGASSLVSALPGLTSLVPSISIGASVTVAASVTIGAGVSMGTPSLSILLTIPTSLAGIVTNLIPTSSLGSLVTIPTSLSNPITGTCDNGGNILNGCIIATATLNPGVGVSGGIGIGPSSSPILAVSLSASLGVSVSAGVDLGVGLSLGSSGLSLGLDPSVGLGVGASGGLGGGLGLGGSGAARTTSSSSARTSATPGAGSPALSLPTPSTTSLYVTPLGPVVTTTPTPSLSTTTVFTTSTITSCLTGLGGVLTCPIGGLFTTLPSTSGAVTSISTSIQTQTSISVSVSISYITITATASSSTSSSRSSSFSTITTFSSRTSSSLATSSTVTVCRGVVNTLGVCIL